MENAILGTIQTRDNKQLVVGIVKPHPELPAYCNLDLMGNNNHSLQFKAEKLVSLLERVNKIQQTTQEQRFKLSMQDENKDMIVLTTMVKNNQRITRLDFKNERKFAQEGSAQLDIDHIAALAHLLKLATELCIKG